MFKTLSFLTLSVCVLSIFIFNNVSLAGDVSDYEYKQLQTRYQNVWQKEGELTNVKTVLSNLNSGWDAKIESATSNVQVALISGGSAVVSGIVAAVSGGSLLPASFAAWVSMFKANEAKKDMVASADYLTAMSSSLTQLDAALVSILVYTGGSVMHFIETSYLYRDRIKYNISFSSL